MPVLYAICVCFVAAVILFIAGFTMAGVLALECAGGYGLYLAIEAFLGRRHE